MTDVFWIITITLICWLLKFIVKPFCWTVNHISADKRQVFRQQGWVWLPMSSASFLCAGYRRVPHYMNGVASVSGGTDTETAGFPPPLVFGQIAEFWVYFSGKGDYTISMYHYQQNMVMSTIYTATYLPPTAIEQF